MSTSPFSTPDISPNPPLPFSSSLYYQTQRKRSVETYSFDRAYVERLAAGDSSTTEHFVRYFQKLLLVKIRFELRDSTLAEDISQETLLRVLHSVQRQGGINEPEKLGAFVMRVSENVMHEGRRQSERFRQVPENAPEPIEHALGAEQNCITDENKRIILREFKKLSGKDQVVLQKVFLEEQDKDAICRELKIDRAYLRVQVHRALGRFRKLLRSDSPAPPAAKKASAG